MNARVLMCLALSLLAGPAFAQSRGQIRLPDLTALSNKASETVTVTLDAPMLGFAAQFLSNDDPEEAKAKKLVRSLTGIYVRHHTFDADYVYPKGDLDGVLQQLSAPGWSRMTRLISG